MEMFQHATKALRAHELAVVILSFGETRKDSAFAHWLDSALCAVFRVPMAVVTIGGVKVAAFLTLLLTPVIYTKMDRLTVRGRREAC